MYYLAHPLEDRHMVHTWQLDVERRVTGLQFLNPFYGSGINRQDIEAMDRGEMTRDESDPQRVVPGDLKAIESCEGLIAIINDKTRYGTPMEIVYAFLKKKPVYLIILNGRGKHPWLVYHATGIFTSFEDFEIWYEANGLV